MAHGSPDLQEPFLKSLILSWRQQETNENKNVELLGRFSPSPYVWRNFPEELLVVQVETIVKNEQFADVEAVNFVKVVVNKEFDGNILTDARRPQSVLLQRCWKMKSKMWGSGEGGDIWSNASFVKNNL